MSTSKEFNNLIVPDHPLISHNLTQIRKECTPWDIFREFLIEITIMIAYEITRDLQMTTEAIKTPVTSMNVLVLDIPIPSFASILRAGLSMAESLRQLLPTAREGHLCMYRNPTTKKPIYYYNKLPPTKGQLKLSRRLTRRSKSMLWHLIAIWMMQVIVNMRQSK